MINNLLEKEYKKSTIIKIKASQLACIMVYCKIDRKSKIGVSIAISPIRRICL
jgi:hypothetical protein